MGPRQKAEFEIAPELGFGGLGSGTEKIEGGEDRQRRGHAAAVVAVDEQEGQGNCSESSERAEGGVEKKVGGRKLVDPLVVVEQGIVKAEVAQGNHEGEQGRGEGDVSEVLRGQFAGKDDDCDPVDEPAGVGAAQGVDRTPCNPPEHHFLPVVCGLRVFRPVFLVHSAPSRQATGSGSLGHGERVEGAVLWTRNRVSLPFSTMSGTFAILQGVDMAGLMTQWMADPIDKKRQKARQEGLREGQRQANEWERRQGLSPPFPEAEQEPPAVDEELPVSLRGGTGGFLRYGPNVGKSD